MHDSAFSKYTIGLHAQTTAVYVVSRLWMQHTVASRSAIRQKTYQWWSMSPKWWLCLQLLYQGMLAAAVLCHATLRYTLP